MKIGIITAASEKYEKSLITLIGSLNCNWPNHPPLKIYDLGLSVSGKTFLQNAGINVENIPIFCNHWRLHYTWKIWCMNNADLDVVIWMDAGICVLQPLDEMIDVINNQDYFLVPNYQFLDYEVSEQACIACGVPYEFRFGKGTIAGTFIGFKKRSTFGKLIEQAFNIALVEDNIKAYDPRNKHDQSIISTLVYKIYPNPVLQDGYKYLGWKSPKMVPEQKIWLQRRNILAADVLFFKEYLNKNGPTHAPKDPLTDITLVERWRKFLIMKAKAYLKKSLKLDKKDGNR